MYTMYIHMCAYVCVYLCMRVYVCVCMCASVYACVCVRMYVCICVCMCMCEYVCVHLCMHVYVCVCMCVSVYACVCVCMYVCICVSVSMCAYVCVYPCMHVYVYVCVCVSVYACVCVRMHVCICVSVCTCAYVCVHLCMHVYVCVCMCVSMYACACVRMYVCICVCLFLCAYVCVHLCMHVYVCVCVCVSAYACVCVRVYVCICVCVRMYVCIYMYIYVHTLKQNSPDAPQMRARHARARMCACDCAYAHVPERYMQLVRPCPRMSERVRMCGYKRAASKPPVCISFTLQPTTATPPPRPTLLPAARSSFRFASAQFPGTHNFLIILGEFVSSCAAFFFATIVSRDLSIFPPPPKRVGNGVLLAQLLRRHFNTFVVGLDGLVKFAEIFVLHCHVVVAHGEDGRFGVVAKVVEHARRHTARVALALEQREGALAVLESVPMSI